MKFDFIDPYAEVQRLTTCIEELEEKLKQRNLIIEKAINVLKEIKPSTKLSGIECNKESSKNYRVAYEILHDAVCDHLGYMGACEDSENNRSLCKNPICTYCNLERALMYDTDVILKKKSQ